MNGPRWIKQWISDLAALNEQFRNDDGLVDFDALGREEYSFRVALITKKFGKSERAREIYRAAKIAYDSSVENGKKGGRPKKSPQDAPNGNAGVDMYDAGNGAASKSPTSCDQFTADASTREGEDERNHRGNTGTMESGTSANNYGDAARREAADGDTDGNVAVARTTTVSNPLALDMPGLDKASDPRGYNTADVPPSYGPEDGTIDNPVLPAGSSHPAGNTPPQFVINHNQRHRPQKPQANSPPRSSEDVRLFALDRNLDIDDARMWYQMNFVDRPGCDKDGVAINNWKGHCTAYCKAEAERRKAG